MSESIEEIFRKQLLAVQTGTNKLSSAELLEMAAKMRIVEEAANKKPHVNQFKAHAQEKEKRIDRFIKVIRDDNAKQMNDALARGGFVKIPYVDKSLVSYHNGKGLVLKFQAGSFEAIKNGEKIKKATDVKFLGEFIDSLKK